MSKYQEALDILKDIEKSNNLKTIGSSLTPESDLLQELVDEKLAKPTEEEIKKEWEELGWKYEKDSLSITLTKSNRVITIYLHNKEYDCTRHNMWKVGTLTFQEHQLLTKTFKMLGWEV